MKNCKMIIFIILILLLIFIFFLGIFGSSISFFSVKDIKKDRKINPDLICDLKINSVTAPYDKNTNTYYYTIGEDKENTNYILNLNFEDNLKYKIIDEKINIVKISYSKEYKIIIYNKKYYYETKIQLTNLPIVKINSKNEITKYDTFTTLNYINSNLKEKEITTNSETHVRGATSTLFPKTGYKITFYNKNFTKDKELHISNFYYGESLILDAVYRDPSKIRNLFSIELWNDMSNDFANVDIYSEFVELFINDEYYGLYVLTEPVNRRKLNLSKSSLKDTSVILKTSLWDVVTSNINIKNIEENYFNGYELKYPNDNSLYSIAWEKILSKLSKYYDNYTNSSYKTIKNTFNINNYIDLIIFNTFINNADNKVMKNNYFYLKNLDSDQIFIQPWDMEYSMGLNYNFKGKNYAEKKMDDYNEIYTDFEHESKEINNLLINRYKELRKNILTKENIDKKLNKYINILDKGSALRDSNIWYEYDIEQEIEEIRTWLYNRLDFFDNYIESLENE